MSKAVLTSALFLSGLSLAQNSHACMRVEHMNKLDVAFAGVIFEGHIKEKNGSQLVFDIDRVVRGDLPGQSVTVGLTHNFAYTAPKSIDDFVKKYGSYVRVAVTTPKQVETFCRERKPLANGKRTIRDCDYQLHSLQESSATEIPIIVKSSCAAPYIIPVDYYEKSRNYEKNLEIYERKLAELRETENPNIIERWESEKALHKDIIGDVRPLPWTYGQNNKNNAVDLYRKDPNIINWDLSSETVVENLYALKEGNQNKWNSENEGTKSRFEKYIIHYLKQIKIVLEKDPNFANRLMEEG